MVYRPSVIRWLFIAGTDEAVAGLMMLELLWEAMSLGCGSDLSELNGGHLWDLLGVFNIVRDMGGGTWGLSLPRVETAPKMDFCEPRYIMRV